MSLFDEYVKEAGLEIIEESAKNSAISNLATEMAHIQKFVYISNANSSWANSIFGSIYLLDKNYKDASAKDKNLISTSEAILDTAYNNALDIIFKNNPNDKNLIPNSRPDDFTYDFLTDYDAVKEYLLNNTKNQNFNQSIIDKCELYKNKRVN